MTKPYETCKCGCVSILQQEAVAVALQHSIHPLVSHSPLFWSGGGENRTINNHHICILHPDVSSVRCSSTLLANKQLTLRTGRYVQVESNVASVKITRKTSDRSSLKLAYSTLVTKIYTFQWDSSPSCYILTYS